MIATKASARNNPASRKRSSAATMAEVPTQNNQSAAAAAEADAVHEVAAIWQRLEPVVARVDHDAIIVRETRQALLGIKSEKTRAIGIAAKWEQAEHMASQALELALADECAAKRRADSCSLPRRVFRCIMARLEAEPLLDVEKATRAVDKAEQVYNFARDETRATREEVDNIQREERATVLLLRNANRALARSKKIYFALDIAADKAEERAAYAAAAVETGRCWKEVYARAGGDKMDLLPATAELAASVGDSFIDDQVAPKAERPKQ